MKTVNNIKTTFWVSLIFALIFVTYLKQVYLFKSVLSDYVGSQAIVASWALAMITEFIRGSFAYASFLASERNFNQTKTISLLISVGISLFDFWEIYHYLDNQAIAYTAYFMVSITLALELLGGNILAEISEALSYEVQEQETTVDTFEQTIQQTHAKDVKPAHLQTDVQDLEQNSKIHSPFVNNIQTDELAKPIMQSVSNPDVLLLNLTTVRKRITKNRKFQSAIALTLF